MAWVRPSVQSSAPCPLPNSNWESRKLTNTMAVTQPGLRTSATPTISRNMYGRSFRCSRSEPGTGAISGLTNWSPMMLS